MTKQADPYDFAANQFNADVREKIEIFWKIFASKADEIGELFSLPDGDNGHIVEAMQPLETVSPDLSWEFGPSDRGHKLCITAEFRDELRPLARLVKHMAPNLEQWRFTDARDAILLEQLKHVHQGRFGMPITLGKVDASIGNDGCIDQVARGVGSKDDLNYQVLNISTLLLGEELERDWIGYVESTPDKARGLFGILGRKNPVTFDAAEWLEMMQDMIRRAQDQMPDVLVAQADTDTRPIVLSSEMNLAPDHRRNDLITFYAASETYMQGVMDGVRFSSRSHSQFDEWFMYLRIPRTKDMPFDQVDDRTLIEDRMHHLLSVDGLGGVVAAGHGTDHVYIDIGVKDVHQAVDRIQTDLRGEGFAARAVLQFLDQGLSDVVVPIHPDDKNHK